MRPSLKKHNLARLRVDALHIGQKEMADVAGCKTPTIQSVELDRLALSESLARRIAAATGVHLHWLLNNDLTAPIVNARGRSYTRSDFEAAQAARRFKGNEFTRTYIRNYALNFYAQIAAILSSAATKRATELATWKIERFLDQCYDEFGKNVELRERRKAEQAKLTPAQQAERIRKRDASARAFERYLETPEGRAERDPKKRLANFYATSAPSAPSPWRQNTGSQSRTKTRQRRGNG